MSSVDRPKLQIREMLMVGVFAFVAAFVLVRLTPRPTYTDSYYHFNAAVRLASGQGLTDAIIWPYLGQPASEQIPTVITPSHVYWMPLTSILAGLSMALFNAPGNYAVAQIPLILCLAGAICTAYWLGFRFGSTRRHAVMALLLTTFGGFFVNYWGEIDTFAPYALIGSLGLVTIGLGAETERPRWWLFGGLLAGLGHLTRADGLLLLLSGWCVIVWPWWKPISLRRRALFFVLFTFGYLVVMLPWFVRMIDAVGAPLPLGGLNGAWFTDYNDLFRYPPEFSPSELFQGGLGTVFATRWEAFVSNLGTFVALEGFVVMTPLMLVGLWRRRGLFTLGMILFTLGLHAAMTLVFPFPGYRGGLFHGVAPLLPWWAALGVVGLDDVIEWVAARRRRWKPAQAKRLFSVALVLLAVVLTITITRPKTGDGTPELFVALAETLPPDARVMLNDPPQLYYFTGLGGSVLPSSPPEVIAAIAERYGITHLLLYDLTLDENGTVIGAPIPTPLWPLLTQPPEFLTPLDFPIPNARLYAVRQAN